MSVNIMVFDKSKAPAEPHAFLEWFRQKSEWTADRDYNEIQGASKPLTDFFLTLVQEYPPMNGSHAPSEEALAQNPALENRLIDYTIDADLIYMGIAYSVEDAVFDRIEALAYQYGLGYFDMVSIHPDRETVIPVPQESKPGKPQKKGFFARLFGSR